MIRFFLFFFIFNYTLCASSLPPEGANEGQTKFYQPRFPEDRFLRENLPQLKTLVLGGIGPHASRQGSVPGLVCANSFSEICLDPSILTVNIQPEADCGIVGDAWRWDQVLSRYPSLENHLFETILWNHVGRVFWTDFFERDEREDLKKQSDQIQILRISERIKKRLLPLTKNLKSGGALEYKSFVFDFLDDLKEELDIPELSIEALSLITPTRYSHTFNCLDPEIKIMKVDNLSYCLIGDNQIHLESPVLQGIERGLLNLGFKEIKIEFVISNWPREAREGPPPPTIDAAFLNYNEYYETCHLGLKKEADLFLRINAIRF